MIIDFSYKNLIYYIFVSDSLIVAVKPKPPVREGYDNNDDDDDLVKTI